MRFLKSRAKCELERACAGFSARIDRYPRRITLRDTRSRWGSCTAAGNLMFSWRLAMAPPEILEYVAAHEVAHLREMNHGAGFWTLVAELTPDYDARRRWLHAHGPALHRYRFEAAGA
jgi:predicted metal-dependent hydrolase